MTRSVAVSADLRVTMAGAAAKRGVPVDEVLAGRCKTIPAGRLGTPREFGAVCAFLCSPQAGYITGQNLLLDGGAFPGV